MSAPKLSNKIITTSAFHYNIYDTTDMAETMSSIREDIKGEAFPDFLPMKNSWLT